MNSSESSIDVAIPVEHRNKILQIALGVLQNSSTNSIKTIEKTSIDINVPIAQIYEALGIYVQVLRQYLESCNDKLFIEKLAKLQLSSDFIENLPFLVNGDEIRMNLANTGYVDMSLLKWRVDISLLNSLLTRKIMPNVIFSITLKDGTRYNIELDGKTFHELRLSVVLILKKLSATKLTSLLNKPA